MCAKRRWRLGGRKCRKMPESDICVCRKAKVVESHIVHVEIELKKKFDFESLVLRKFRKITANSQPWYCAYECADILDKHYPSLDQCPSLTGQTLSLTGSMSIPYRINTIPRWINVHPLLDKYYPSLDQCPSLIR